MQAGSFAAAIYWVSFLDGLQRVLLFTDDFKAAYNASQVSVQVHYCIKCSDKPYSILAHLFCFAYQHACPLMKRHNYSLVLTFVSLIYVERTPERVEEVHTTLISNQTC